MDLGDHVWYYLKSYYQNRRQYVYSNGFSSESSSVVCGVPQGSILGPICFSLYTNDMPFAVKVDVVLFPMTRLSSSHVLHWKAYLKKLRNFFVTFLLT